MVDQIKFEFGALHALPVSNRLLSRIHRWVAGRFSWQEGFGAFSCSRSQLDTVIRYIQNQQKHHTRKTFRQEYVELLEKFGIDYDERYIFKTEYC